MDVLKQLEAIASLSPSSRRPEAYQTLLEEILAQPSSSQDGRALIESLGTFLDHAAFSDSNASGGNLLVGRQVLSNFETSIARAGKEHAKNTDTVDDDHTMHDQDPSLPAIADETVRCEVLQMTLDKVQPRVLSFEEQATSMRLQLADLLEEQEDWLEAAKVLQQIPLDSGHRSVSDLVKLRTYVRIVRLMLEGDDAIGADAVLKRASLIIHRVPGTSTTSLSAASSTTQQEAWKGMSEEEKMEAKTLGLQYKLSQARIYDSQRKFAEAANRYHEVSYVTDIDEGERKLMLSAAVTASILAPAGPQRSRILATLIRDERTQSLQQHTILTKTFLDQIIRPKEIQEFQTLLSPHQLATLPSTNDTRVLSALRAKDAEDAEMKNGETENAKEDVEESSRFGPSTVLDRAMMEHNIVAASRVYSNITLRGLGSLLDVHSLGAETLVRRMIVQGRLKAEIDQVAGLIIFGEQKTHSVSVAGASATSKSVAAAGQGDTGGSGDQTSQDRDGVDDDDPSTLYFKRWDASIAKTASSVEEVCARLRARGFAAA